MIFYCTMRVSIIAMRVYVKHISPTELYLTFDIYEGLNLTRVYLHVSAHTHNQSHAHTKPL